MASCLTDSLGRFRSLVQQLLAITSGRVSPEAIKTELRLPIEFALSHGMVLDHLDSHHHLHVHPFVAPIIVALAREYDISVVRVPAERFVDFWFRDLTIKNRTRTLIAWFLGTWFRRLVDMSGLRHAEHFRGASLGMGFDTPCLLNQLSCLPEGTTELMVHPGLNDDSIQICEDSLGREQELGALIDPETLALVSAQRIRLIKPANLNA